MESVPYEFCNGLDSGRIVLEEYASRRRNT
jgi:hypothetical protein